ncbi:MAG: TetR/AcrR family transcriptional regulator [Bacteroidetes bacterium]|nr:TetR/AcrR family transcriptional regulator [Bacteroidota bacterium]
MPKVKQFDKEKVLETASSIFQQKGFNGTSIDDIIKATGLSRSSLYDSFSDKHNLYLQSLEYYKTHKDGKFMQKANNKNLSPMQKIECVFNEVVNHLVKNPNDNGCLLVNAAAEMSKQCDKTSQVVCNNKEEVQKLFGTWLTDAQKANEVTLSKPINYYGQFLFNALCGLKVLSQSGANKAELSNVVKVTLAALD